MVIYLAHNKVNLKNYVGQTTRSIQKRIISHYSFAKNNTYPFANALRKYNGDDFEWCSVMECDSREELNLWEQFYIKLLNSEDSECGYNIQPGGDNHEMAIETKLKLSQNKKGRVAWNKGLTGYYHHTPEDIEKFRQQSASRIMSFETKEKIRQSKLGKKRPPEVVEKMSLGKIGKYVGEKNPFYGKKHSPLTLELLSLRHKGKKRTEEEISKQREALKARYKENPVNEETKKKMSEARKQYWLRKKQNAA